MPPADEYTDRANALLEQCLDAPIAKQQDVLDALAAAHPELEGELRDRYRQLRDAGLLESVGGVMRATEVARLSRGSMFGDFRILRELGRGGMGVVYLAEQVSMRRQVALKLLRADVLADARIRQRFDREVEAASSLEHSGISTIYAAGEVRGTPYIAMRYVPGETLRSRIRRGSRGDTDGSPSTSSKSSTQAMTMATLYLVERIARALHYAHERGFIHRDIKPGNVIVTDGDEPVLLDFGLARPEDHTGDSLTLSGDALGTPAYMAPEQISPNGRRIDRRADVYSLGVTLYECLTGHTPFEAPTREELYRLILATGRVDTAKHTRLPRDLQVVLHTALARERDRRYQTALDFAEDLECIRERKPIAARPASLAERVWSWTRREPLKAALLVIVPLLCLLGGYLWARSDEIDAGAEALRRLQLDVALARGFAGLDTGAPADAEAAFRQARSIAPSDREAAAGLAMSLLVQDKRAAADALIAAFGPASFEVRCVNAWIAIMSPGRDRDQDSLDSVPEPETATGYFLLGTAARKHVGNHQWQERAQAAFLKAIARSERARMHYYVGLVSTSQALRDTAWIRAGSQTMVELWPDQALAWATVAVALDSIDHDAAQAATRELERWPKDIYATCVRGKLALKREPARAARILEPTLGRAWFSQYMWCAQAFWDAGDTDRAIKVLEKAVARWPFQWQARAKLALYQDDHRAAEAAYQRMIERWPYDSRGYVGLALCLDKRGLADALEPAQRAIELDPNNHAGQRVLARALFRAGQTAKARRIAARVLETEPDEPFNCRTAAHIALRSGDHANAAAFYRRLAQLRPHLTPYYNFGFAEQRLGHYRQAACHYRKHLAQIPGHAQSYINLGLSLFCMHDLERALQMMEKGEALGRKRKGWKSFAGWIAQVRRTRQSLTTTRPSAPAISSLSLDEARLLADSAYWHGEDRRCVEAFRQAVSKGLPWTPRTAYRLSIRWAAHAAVRVGDGPSRNLAREWLGRLLRVFETRVTSAKRPLRLVMHQELYSWLSHERLASVRQGSGLENLPEEEQATWRSFWKRARKLATILDPWP